MRKTDSSVIYFAILGIICFCAALAIKLAKRK